MANYQPAPTFAPVLIIDESKQVKFNPIWLNWFLQVTAGLSPGGGPSFDNADNIIANQVFGG